MKILITGGTGFLGKRLVQKLLAEGHDVSVFSRKRHEDMPKSVSCYEGDIRDAVALRRAFMAVKPKAVYHLAINMDESDKEMYDTNVEGTRNVASLCKEFKVQQLIFMSSSGVLGETRVPAKENFPYNPKTLYEKSKMESEKIIRDSGVTYTIIRTTIVIGPNLIWAQIFEAARRGFPIIGSGKNYFHLVYVDDVVSALVRVFNNNRAINQVFHIASPDTPTYEEVYKMIAQTLRVPMTEKHVSLRLAYLACSLHGMKCKITGKKPKLTRMRSSIDRLVRNRIISTEKAERVLGFEPKYTTAAAIRDTIKYLKISRLGYSDYDIAEIHKVTNK